MRLMMAACAVGLVVGLSSVNKAEDSEKITVKMVMAKAMKEGLCKKVAEGEASDAEKAELLKMFQVLAKAKPAKGDAESWKTKTQALLVSAQAAADGKAGAGPQLMKAANCKNCHSVHK